MTHKLSIFAGTAVVPTLARLVLGMAFVYAGSAKLFKSQQFNSTEARELESVGVILQQAPTAVAGLGSDGVIVVRASYRQADEGGSAKGGAEEQPVQAPSADGAAAQSAEPAKDAGSGEADSEPESAIVEGAVYEGKQLNGLILLIHGQGMQNPVLMAWAASLTEFVGGILILIGLFSRVWALGLATIMVVAVYMTTWQPLIDGRLFGMDPKLFGTLTTQLGLFVLAFGVMLTGAGPLSLDRMLFARKSAPVARRSSSYRPVDEHDEPRATDGRKDRSDIPLP